MTKKISIPLELKYDFAIRGYASFVARILHAIREKYGSAEALEIYERTCKMGDSIMNLTNRLLTIFKIEGNDAEAIANCLNIWYELCGYEVTWLEMSRAIFRNKVTKCPWKIELRELSDRCSIFNNIVIKTINPKATFEQPKGMCAGDTYCESVVKIED